MKKTFLMVFIVIMFSTHCLAQPEAKKVSSINNTLWTIFPYNSYFGFSGGEVYICDEELESCEPIPNSSYTDLLLRSIVYIPIAEEYPGFIYGFLSPRRGIGTIVVYNYRLMYFLTVLSFKANDNWTP